MHAHTCTLMTHVHKRTHTRTPTRPTYTHMRTPRTNAHTHTHTHTHTPHTFHPSHILHPFRRHYNINARMRELGRDNHVGSKELLHVPTF